MNPGVIVRKPRIGHLMVMFGLFLALFSTAFQATNPGRTVAFGTSEVAQLSNQYRLNSNLPALILSETLTKSAQAKADDMASKAYFAHNAPDGTTPWSFFDGVKYSYTTAGENLALTNQLASSVVDGWYNSPGHRANMLSDQFTEVGYGIAFVPTFTYNNTLYSNVYLVAAHYAKPVEVATNATKFTIQPTATNVLPASSTPTRQESGKGVTTIKDTNPVLARRGTYISIGLGSLLVLLGSIVEIRRLLKHQPLLPHHW